MAKVDISKLMKKAEEALNRRNYGLAIFSYSKALSLQPENIDARIKLRATQSRAANESGGGSFVKALVPYLKSIILATLGKKEQAMIACENAITCAPDNISLLKQLATCAEDAEFIEVAAWQRQEIADKHDREDIDNLWALGKLYEDLGRGSEAVSTYERIQEIDPKADVGQEIRNASALMTSDTYADAFAQGSHEIVKDSEEAEHLELVSGTMKTDEQRNKAINYILAHDAKDRPDDHRVYIQLGDIFYNLDDFETGYKEASKYFNKALELNPTDSNVRDKLGDLEIKKVRMDLLALQNRLKANPNDQEAKSAYQQKNRDRVVFEIKEYERRVKEQPLKALFHYKLGELYYQTKNYDGAIGELQLAGKDPKYKITALTILGRSFHAMEQYDMAINQYQNAVKGQELFDKIRDPMYYEAMAFEAKGDAESLKKSLELYTKIYQTEINFKDVKAKVPELQKKIKELVG
ncbi:MAG: tetratricopeptide repeat protein [Planctomycetes bacterium]|nr:tetratricopeptide repeat protein [Planctomycetota bacterium]